MIDKKLVKKINDIRSVCASVKMPVNVEADSSPDGIDGLLILGDLSFEKFGDVYDVSFNVTIQYSTAKANWEMFLEKIGLLSQKLGNDKRYVITGWTKQDDESKLIYTCGIICKGSINSDLLG
jgi:hypothetical protein